MFRVGVQALERGEYTQALEWFENDSQNWKSGDRRFEKLYSARMEKLLADDSSNRKQPAEIAKLIREAISKTSPSWFQIDSAQKLAQLEEVAGNESGKRSAWESLVSTAKGIEKDPEVLSGEEAEIRDVLIARGDAEKELGRMDDSRATFLRAADNAKELLRGMGAKAPTERGWQLDLAYSLRRAGKTKEAEALYRSLIGAYPREFTYHNQLARFFLEEKRYVEAEKAAREAYSFSYGDNRLRTAKVLADALSNQGKHAEAVSFLRQTLSETKAPVNPLNSTNYHLKTLKALETKLAAKAAGQK
jgi:tetratricopeptide (TPR) repeat protein